MEGWVRVRPIYTGCNTRLGLKIHTHNHVHHTKLYYNAIYTRHNTLYNTLYIATHSFSYQVSFISDLRDTTGGQGGVEVVKILLIISGDVCDDISLSISVFCSGFIYGLTPSSEKIIAYIHIIRVVISGRNPKTYIREYKVNNNDINDCYIIIQYST